MIILIDENKQLEDLIDEANFSEMGVWERTHMEEWIAERPDILGEPLLTLTTEYAGFDKTSKRLDILAVDKSGKLVVIELKRDIANVFVDLQAIHYAAYCSTLTFEQVAEIRTEYNKGSKEKNESEIIDFIESDFTDFDNQPRIILVANDFKEETLAAVLWLRDSGVDITCVKLEAYNIGKKIVITPDVIIPLPEAKEFMVFREQKTKVTSYKEPQHWDEESFKGRLLENSSNVEVQIVDKILSWANDEIDWIYWGQGKKTGAFVPILVKDGIDHQLFAVKTNSAIEIYFQHYKNKEPFKSEEKRKELLKKLNTIVNVNIPLESIAYRPTINLSALKDDKELNKFLKIFEWVSNEIKSS